jgi:2-hydroxychromene-2-carboxylate isomerase
MDEVIPASWYFDTISPYAYLHLQLLGRLDPRLDIRPVPVLFGGLLKHWETKGPAEIDPKRQHTYRQCVWLARRYGVPFRLPPRHPFKSLDVQRLIAARGARWEDVRTAFEFVWAEGRDPEGEWPALCARLGAPDADATIADPAVKERLAENTQAAVAAGVFGVPTLVVRGERFWGSDTIDWVNAFLGEPDMFGSGEMARVETVEYGVRRRF